LIETGGTVITTPGTVAGLAPAVIGAQAGSDGSVVHVVGAGSGWHVTGTLSVGDAAAGSLAIAAGGTVMADQMDTGVLAGGSGIVSVVGTGSALTLTGQLTIGDAASAELSILNNATVAAFNGDIGLNAGSTGNVDIEGTGSRLDIANNLNIGDAGVGVLTLGNNTTLTVVNNLNIGANGVLNQFGGVIDPSTITIAPGGRQGGHGSTSATVDISNAGTLFASSGTETVTTPLITAPSGKTGVLEIDTSGDLVLNVGSVDGAQSVTFTDGTGVLTIGTLGGFAATIIGFNAGDQIILPSVTVASDSFDASTHVLTLFDASSTQVGTLQFGAGITNGSTISVNGVTPCFVAGRGSARSRVKWRWRTCAWAIACRWCWVGVGPLPPSPSRKGRGSGVCMVQILQTPPPLAGGGWGEGSLPNR
jgi:T5SS/PEP-CTERM-associated repeat protein